MLVLLGVRDGVKECELTDRLMLLLPVTVFENEQDDVLLTVNEGDEKVQLQDFEIEREFVYVRVDVEEAVAL